MNKILISILAIIVSNYGCKKGDNEIMNFRIGKELQYKGLKSYRQYNDSQTLNI